MSRKPSSLVERRLHDGARIIAEVTGDEARPVQYTFADTGRTARADVVARLIADGKLIPTGDGLFPEFSQTYELAHEARL